MDYQALVNSIMPEPLTLQQLNFYLDDFEEFAELFGEEELLQLLQDPLAKIAYLFADFL